MRIAVNIYHPKLLQCGIIVQKSNQNNPLKPNPLAQKENTTMTPNSNPVRRGIRDLALWPIGLGGEGVPCVARGREKGFTLHDFIYYNYSKLYSISLSLITNVSFRPHKRATGGRSGPIGTKTYRRFLWVFWRSFLMVVRLSWGNNRLVFWLKMEEN